MKDTDIPHGDLLAQELDVDLNMLRAPVTDRVSDHVDGANVIAVYNGRYGERSTSSWSSRLSQQHSATARYSVSALEQEMMVWCLDDQDTR